MLFNSFGFIFLFLPFSVIGFHLLRQAGRSNLALDWLIACSWLFYAWGNPNNLPVLIASLLFNFVIARSIGAADSKSTELATTSRRKYFLIFGISANLLLLSYYKYFDHLPLGISFFTLMQVMYLVDCYERMITPSTLREHALFVSFFPAVSMGPLIRAKETLSQFRNSITHGVSAEQLATGLFLFCIGLFKKVVIADSFAQIADAGYSSPGTLSMLEGWLSSVSYALQLYYDFSGYSDMAVASALVLGISIPINFNSPYQARSIVDFWNRWHISLSNFITTYLYTPIVRSFKKLTFEKAMWATIISMIIAGLWHGSSLNFIIFGALHGLGLVVNQYRKKYKKKLPIGIAWALTFIYVNFTFIFFRAQSLQDAFDVIQSLVNLNSIIGTETLKLSEKKLLFVPFILGLSMIFCKRNSNQIVQGFLPSWKNVALASLALTISLIYMNSNIAKEFLYFDF